MKKKRVYYTIPQLALQILPTARYFHIGVFRSEIGLFREKILNEENRERGYFLQGEGLFGWLVGSNRGRSRVSCRSLLYIQLRRNE